MALTFGLLLAAIGACAQMPDSALPLPDLPRVWHRLTLDDRTTSSRCIGRFETPLCTAETLIACFAREESALCDAALAIPQRFTFRGNDVKYLSRELYRVESARRLTNGDRSRYAIPLEPGDVILEIAARGCYRHDEIPDNCGPIPRLPDPYLLRKIGTRWYVLAWGERANGRPAGN